MSLVELQVGMKESLKGSFIPTSDRAAGGGDRILGAGH